MSPFTRVLQLHASTQQSGDLRTLLQSVSEEYHILSYADGLPSIDILTYSLRSIDRTEASNEFYRFLDSCILQCSRKSVLYHETRKSLTAQQESAARKASICDIDLLAVAVADQWPFLVKDTHSHVVLSIAEWFCRTAVLYYNKL